MSAADQVVAFRGGRSVDLLLERLQGLIYPPGGEKVLGCLGRQGKREGQPD
jgi:hypothetical protein